MFFPEVQPLFFNFFYYDRYCTCITSDKCTKFLAKNVDIYNNILWVYSRVQNVSTVKPVWNSLPWCHEKVVFQDRLFAWIPMVERTFQQWGNGLSRQCGLYTGVVPYMFHYWIKHVSCTYLMRCLRCQNCIRRKSVLKHTLFLHDYDLTTWWMLQCGMGWSGHRINSTFWLTYSP